MGVTAELQVEAGCFGRVGAARLVREQQPERRRPAAGERGARIARLGPVEMTGTKIGDPGDHERCIAPAQNDVLVHQHDETDPPQLAHP